MLLPGTLLFYCLYIDNSLCLQHINPFAFHIFRVALCYNILPDKQLKFINMDPSICNHLHRDCAGGYFLFVFGEIRVF